MLEKNVISSLEKKNIGDKLISELDLDQITNSGIMTMCSESIAKRMILLDGTFLLGNTLRFSPYIETKYEENTHKGNQALANSADLSAKSAAVAYAALDSFVNKKEDVEAAKDSTALVSTSNNNKVALFGKFKNIQLNTTQGVQLVPELVLKVMNIVGSNILTMSTDEYNELKSDVKNEFEKYGKVINMFFVSRKSYCKIGAEIGSIFIEFDDIKFAEMAYYAMKEKKYDGKEFKICFVNKKVFYEEILPESKRPKDS